MPLRPCVSPASRKAACRRPHCTPRPRCRRSRRAANRVWAGRRTHPPRVSRSEPRQVARRNTRPREAPASVAAQAIATTSRSFHWSRTTGRLCSVVLSIAVFTGDGRRRLLTTSCFALSTAATSSTSRLSAVTASGMVRPPGWGHVSPQGDRPRTAEPPGWAARGESDLEDRRGRALASSSQAVASTGGI